ncbi:four-carbon acid sugar kinase family protein [Klebsiella pasteurii]|uniref:D-threonate kinase n=1 Tax=Klebsiella pasteurii TaxID=2587529 RepID=UPI002542DC2C|nr:four-carbon acid sugar kinase family protein [Klebsiella pasteurii]WII84399.1 four-carbon acid sugar kinase family protein [Klebsiella pasteurii]
MGSGDNKVLVLADDFTGANDAGVSLAETGMRAEVAFSDRYRGEAQALILNSDSRAQPAAEAARRITYLLQAILPRFQPRWTVKKIDSTLRGNLGAELEATMRALACSVAVLAPAFPAAGRVTREGLCYVRGLPVNETEFATDPKTPVGSADIAAVVAQQSELRCLRATVDTLATALAQTGDVPRVLIVDAEEDRQLDAIIEAVAACDRKVLLAGSAGLCDALARRLAAVPRGPLLAIVGSMSEIAQQQVARLEAHPRVVRVEIDVAMAFGGDVDADARRIAAVLSENNHCVVTTRPDSEARKGIDALCRQHGVDRTALGERICAYLAQVSERAIAQRQPGALYLSGGDVAIAVAQALGASGFHITGRVAQCVPYGNFLGSSWQRPVMTKAGGFGTETSLLEVVNFIEEKMSD